MKRKILSIILFFLMGIGLSAFTRKEYIQENLSKLGIKQSIIDETVKLDKETGNIILGNEENVGKIEKYKIKKLENIFAKDVNNYIILQKLMNIAGRNKDEKKIKEYENYYLKINLPEDKKNFFLGEYFLNLNEEEKSDKYLKKVKNESKNILYLKMIEFFEITEEKNAREKRDKSEKENRNMMDKTFSLMITKSQEINKILDNKALMDEYGITDEEVYSRRLDIISAGTLAYILKGEMEKGIDYYIENIANRKISKEVAEYNKEKDMTTMKFILMSPFFGLFFQYFKDMGDNKDTDKMNDDNLEKIYEKLEKTEKFRQLEKEGLMERLEIQ
ncbi:MAG: hypothetical protein Q4D53_05785 [Leptotrichiaceae bacterium]|nr:hypothetical protein [Leptotrichiaceae bacterium]